MVGISVVLPPPSDVIYLGLSHPALWDVLFPAFPTLSLDSTWVMFWPRSTLALVRDKSTNPDSTRTAPTSKKPHVYWHYYCLPIPAAYGDYLQYGLLLT